jgi:hypothetical protein
MVIPYPSGTRIGHIDVGGNQTNRHAKSRLTVMPNAPAKKIMAHPIAKKPRIW